MDLAAAPKPFSMLTTDIAAGATFSFAEQCGHFPKNWRRMTLMVTDHAKSRFSQRRLAQNLKEALLGCLRCMGAGLDVVEERSELNSIHVSK